MNVAFNSTAYNASYCDVRLEAGSADMAILDLPYGVTSCSWDLREDVDRMWEWLSPVLTPDAVTVCFAVQPFTTDLILSNRDNFRYDLVWEKPNGTNPFQAKKRPMRVHESILVFGGSHYAPQMDGGRAYIWDSKRSKGGAAQISGGGRIDNKGERYPRSVLRFKQDRGIHPTQKPVELCRWLVRTFCPDGGTVLDPTMGSGTSGVAAGLEGRGFIGIESDESYCGDAVERIAGAT